MNIVAIDVKADISTLEITCFDVIVSPSKLWFFVVYRPPYYDDPAICYLNSLLNSFTQFATNSRTTAQQSCNC